MSSDSLVIIPTYNEIGNIENITRKVMSLQGNFHLLIIDDGSPDGTADIVKSLMKEFDVWRVPDEAVSPELGSKSGYAVHLAILRGPRDDAG